MEPNDTFEDDLKTIQYNKAIDALIPIVKESYVLFDAVVFDTNPDLYNRASEEFLKEIHKAFYTAEGCTWFASETGEDDEELDKLFDDWRQQVVRESERRVIG